MQECEDDPNIYKRNYEYVLNSCISDECYIDFVHTQKVIESKL